MFSKLGNVALVIIAVIFLLLAGYVAGQRTADATAVKVVLADMTVHANDLEKQNIQIKNTLANFALELHSLKSDSVDKVMRKYGI